MTEYQKKKEKARTLALEFLELFSEGKTVYYSDIAAWNERLLKAGKHGGLLKEFRENGII